MNRRELAKVVAATQSKMARSCMDPSPVELETICTVILEDQVALSGSILVKRMRAQVNKVLAAARVPLQSRTNRFGCLHADLLAFLKRWHCAELEETDQRMLYFALKMRST